MAGFPASTGSADHGEGASPARHRLGLARRRCEAQPGPTDLLLTVVGSCLAVVVAVVAPAVAPAAAATATTEDQAQRYSGRLNTCRSRDRGTGGRGRAERERRCAREGRTREDKCEPLGNFHINYLLGFPVLAPRSDNSRCFVHFQPDMSGMSESMLTEGCILAFDRQRTVGVNCFNQSPVRVESRIVRRETERSPAGRTLGAGGPSASEASGQPGPAEPRRRSAMASVPAASRPPKGSTVT